jgi:alkanesulfonate monooxygenase SsuD/methylene tetrahydromethanopterin reductase-like flavin-dependent oxidoreductase (luciferase family)
VQKPHPPVIVGGAGPRTLDRVIEYGDGWMPIGGRTGQVLGQMIEDLRRREKEAGRGPLPVSVFGVPHSPEVIESYAAMGVERCIFGLRPEPAEKAIPALKRYVEAAGL